MRQFMLFYWLFEKKMYVSFAKKFFLVLFSILSFKYSIYNLVLTKIADRRYGFWVNWLSLKVLKCDFLSIKVTFKESVSSLDLHIEVFPVLSLLSVCSFFPWLISPGVSFYLVTLSAY